MRTRYLRALIVVLFVAGITSATFFVSNRLSSSQNVAPNAPVSKPFALTSTIRNGVRLPDEDIRDIQRTTATTTKSNVPLVDRSDERDYVPRPASTPAPTQNPASPTSAPDNQANYQTPTSSQSYPPNRPPTTPPATSTPATNIPAATPTFVQGTFGSQATAQQRANDNSYMSDAKNNCTDKQGFISGTGCREDGTRFVLGLPETQRAYQQALNKAQNEITNKTDAELIQISGITCKDTDQTCKNDAIKIATNQLLKANAVVLEQDKDKISDTRIVNQATKDILFATDEEFTIKYGTTNRETGFEKLLVKLGVTKESLGVEVDTSKLVASREVLAKYADPNVSLGTLRSEYCKDNPICSNSFKREDILNNLQLPTDYKNTLITAYRDDATNGQKITEQTTQYLSDKSDQELAKDFCAKSGNRVACEKSFDREDLIAYNPNPQEIIQMKKDQSLVQLYADPRNSASDLAKIYCKGNRSCEENFTTDRFLSQISSPLSKQDAINNRNIALSTLIPQVVSGKPVTGIDVETKKEIVKLNEDTTYAFWVYVRDPLNAARQRKDNISTEQLALEFNEIVKNNPSALTENLKKYNENPKLYNMSFTSFKFDKEENPLIIAQYNQITKTQSVPGLAKDGKAVIWDNADPLYKLKAMSQACQSGGSILTSNECRSVSSTLSKLDNANNPSEEDKKIIASFANTVLADKFGNTNKSQVYLQEVFNNDISGILLTVNQSNLATVDNTSNDPILKAEIEKAKLSAENKEAENIIFNPKYGFGNMSGTSISVPTSAKDLLPEPQKLTEKQKTDLANEYLRRQLVVETQTRGTGVAGALASAAVATAICSGAGGLAVICGGVGGAAGVISNLVPILGRATAEEIEAERQKIASFVGNDAAATFIQAMYSNQGAASDESWFGGRSQSTLNNQYALLDRIHEANYLSGATTNSLTDLDYREQLALQPFLLQQGELLQEANQQQQIVNIASSLVVGGISGGVGGSLANKAATQLPNSLASVFRSTGDDILLWAGGAAINDVQTQYQFDQTVGYIDTQSEIDLEKCNRAYGSGSEICKDKLKLVLAENDAAKDTARQQAIITDAIIQTGQTVTSFSTSLYGYFRPPTNSNTPNPQANINQTISPNDSTFISPELAQLLNLSDPRILNASPNDIDTITYSNYLASQTTGGFNSSELLENTNNFVNSKPGVADESIMQGVVIYKDLNIPEFKAKLKEIGFDETSIELAVRIRETNADIAYTEALNERISQNETIANQMRNNRDDISENRNTKVDEEIMSDYADFRKQQAEKIVSEAKKALGVENEKPVNNNQPVATAIDTKMDALKSFLAEAASPERIVPMNPTDITNYLTNLSFSPDDIQYVIARATLPEVKVAIDKVLDFNNRSTQIRKEIAIIDQAIQDDINIRINNQKFDLLNDVAKGIPDVGPTNNSLADRTAFKPYDDIHQSIPGGYNTIGKIPPKEIDGQQVFYKISYLDDNGVETGLSNALPLEDTNPLPQRGNSFILEFGTMKDGNFTKLTPSGLGGIQTLAINVSNQYSFGTPPRAVSDAINNRTTSTNTKIAPNDNILDSVGLAGKRAKDFIRELLWYNTANDSSQQTPNQPRLTLEDITSLPPELLTGLTATERTQINNLVDSINNSTSPNQREVFRNVLDQQINSFLNREADTNLIGTTNNPNTPPITFENTIKYPKDSFTESQLNEINNLIGIINNSTSPKLKESATQALNQLMNEYENNAQFIVPVNDTANNPSTNPSNTNILQKAISSVVNFIRNIPEGRKAPEQGGISFRLGSAGNVDGDWEKVFGGLIWIKREKALTSNTSETSKTSTPNKEQVANDVNRPDLDKILVLNEAQRTKDVEEQALAINRTRKLIADGNIARAQPENSAESAAARKQKSIEVAKRNEYVYKMGEEANATKTKYYTESRRLATLKEETASYTGSTENLPQFLKEKGFRQEEIEYVLNNNYPNPILVLDKLSQIVLSYTGNKENVTFDLFRTTTTKFGYTGSDLDLVSQFFEINGGSVNQRQLLEFVANMEIARIDGTSNAQPATSDVQTSQEKPIVAIKTDHTGKLIVKDDRLPGVTLALSAESPESVAARSLYPQELAGKGLTELRAQSPEEVSDLPNLSRSLSEQIKSKYTPDEIKDLSEKINDPTHKIVIYNNPNSDKNQKGPVLDIINTAKKYNIEVQNRYLIGIVLDIRSIENQIINNNQYQPPLNVTQRQFSTRSTAPRLAEKIIEVFRIDPNAKINNIEFKDVRYWSLDYFDTNPNWLEYVQNIKSNRKIPRAQKNTIIKASREYLTDRINASLKISNRDLITYPKGNGITILDLHPNRENSLAMMKKFLGETLITDTQNAINDLNSALSNNGNINNIKIDKKWGIKNLDLKDFRAGDIVTLSISQDPKLPVIARFVDNDIYFTFQGDNNEVLTAVFGNKLKKELGDLDPNFPVIEQTNLNDPAQKTIPIPEKGIYITGKKIDPDFISDSPKTPVYEEITRDKEVAHLSSFNSNDSGAKADGLLATLTREQRQDLMDGKIVHLYLKDTTEATVNKITQVASDLTGFSAISDTVTKVASGMTDRVQAQKLFDGSADMEDIYQQRMRTLFKDDTGFIPFESAGDGLRGFSTDPLDVNNLSKLVDASSIYQDLLVESLAGKHGENAQLAAKTIVAELGDDSIYFKIGVSTGGDTKMTFLPGGKSTNGQTGYSVEVKPSGDTDIYLDNVKKYINLIKKQGGKPPRNIIGISKDVYKTLVDTNQINSLNTLGKKVITVNIPEFGKAYFITNTDYTSPIKNNAIKTNIVKFIDFIKGNIFSNGQSQVNTSQPNLAASTINTESSHIQESAVNKQKTISPDEKAAILKMWGVDQTERELALNPSPENISKIKKYFLEPNDGSKPLTPKELVIDLIDSGLISIVHHDAELYYHLEKYFVETTGYTYSSLTNPISSHTASDGPLIIKKLNEVFGYTNEEILTNLRLIGFIKKEDPQVFFTVFGIDNKYQSYISKFGQSDTEDLFWASLVTKEFTNGTSTSITKTLVDLGMPVDRIINLLDSNPTSIDSPTTSSINLNDIVILKQWGVSDETILETVLKNTGRIFTPEELRLAGLTQDTILKYSDIKWFTPTANRLDKLKQPFRKAKVAIDKTLISQRLKLDVARSGEVSKQKLKSFTQAVQNYFAKLTGKQQIVDTTNPDYIKNAPFAKNNEMRSQRRTEIIGRISGTSIATSTLTLLAHMFGIIELPLDNNGGAVDLSTGAYLVNSQPTPIITPSPTLTPTPTISPTTTIAPAFNIQNEYKIEDNDITRSQLNVYQAINECQNTLDNASFTPENMSKCFCQAMEDNCQGATTKEISTRIQKYYSSKNMILTNESTTYLFEPIFDSKIINPETGKLEPSYCQNSNSQICSTTNDPKFTLCDPSTAEKLFPSDMIVDQNDNVYNCQFGSNYDSATGNITCIIVSATGDKNKLSNTSSVPFNMADAKKIIRSSQYKDNDVDKCWD